MFRLLLLLLLCTSQVWAQDTHTNDVTATYEVTTQIQRDLPPELAHLRSRMATATTAARRLRYDGAQAITDDAPTETAAADGPQGGIQMRGSSMGTVHLDVAEHKVLQQVDFLERRFLVEKEAPRIEWRLTEEAAEFLGYPTYKAVATVGDKRIEAWFAPGISAPVGPDMYGGLPGLILVLTEDEGRRTYVAQEIALAPLREALEPPAEGRRMTGDAYEQMAREKIEELKSSRRPGAVFIPAN